MYSSKVSRHKTEMEGIRAYGYIKNKYKKHIITCQMHYLEIEQEIYHFSFLFQQSLSGGNTPKGPARISVRTPPVHGQLGNNSLQSLTIVLFNY